MALAMSENAEAMVFAELGETGIQQMVAAFYCRVKDDDLIGAMYPDQDWEGAEKRLADFLIFRFGGPPRYIEERGHPRLRMRHAPFAIGEAERDRWLKLMGDAMDERAVGETSREVLDVFFAQVADFMRNKVG
jgi:hemoglobin